MTFKFSRQVQGVTRVSWIDRRGRVEDPLCYLHKVNGKYLLPSLEKELGPFTKRWDAAEAYLKWREMPAILKDREAIATSLNDRNRPRRESAFFTKDLAEQVFQILVEECGALAGDLDSFLFYHVASSTLRSPSTEYRFQGLLGFGGKFYNSLDRWCVGCYPEEENVDTLKMINAANQKLDALFRATVVMS